MSPEQSQRSQEEFRLHVAQTALRLFQKNGFEATTVDHIATAAGVSRRTLFRQFGSKDDMVFADHESLLAELSRYLWADDAADPWLAICNCAVMVFESFARSPELSIQRYQIQRSVPALRDREIVTSYRYERLFVDHLRKAEPTCDDLTIVCFAAAVIATHNYLLRQALRRSAGPSSDDLRAGLTRVRDRFHPVPPEPTATTVSHPAGQQGVVVVTYPADTGNDQILAAIRSQLDQQRSPVGGT